MTPSLSLALIAFLQRTRSWRRHLRSFMLRCVLFLPRILRNLRNLWSLYFQTGSNATGRKKTGGETGVPSSTGTMQEWEGYSVICASKTFDRVGEASKSHSIPRSANTEEPIELGTDVRRPPSGHSSYRPPLRLSIQDPPLHLASPLPTRNFYPSSGSSRAGSPSGTRELIIDQSPYPLPYGHLHATSRQFTGENSPTLSSPPSPSLFRRHPPSPIARAELGVGGLPRPDMIQEPRRSPEVPADRSPSITVQPPSRSGTLVLQAPYSPSRPSESRLSESLVHGQTQSPPTRHDSSPIKSMDSSADPPPSPVHGVPVDGTLRTHHSGGSVDGGFLTPQPIQATPQSVFSSRESVASRISLTTNASSTQAGPEKRTIRPMHSDQVSRYVKRGRV